MNGVNQNRLTRVKTNILIGNIWTNSSALLIAILVMGIFYRKSYEIFHLYSWLSLMGGILIARAIVAKKYFFLFDQNNNFNSEKYYKYYCVLSLIIAFLIGGALIYLSARSEIFLKAFLVCFACGFVAGSSFVYGAFKKMSISYSLIIGASIIWSHRGINNELDMLIVVFCFIFIAAMVKSMSSLNDSMTKRILQSFEIERMSLELEKKYEELSLNNQKLKQEKVKVLHSSRLAAVGGMSGSIAHEINNPLSVILTVSSLIERHIKKNDKVEPKNILENVNKIKNMVDRMVKIVRSIKQYTRKDFDEMRKICSLSDIINETSDLARDRIKEVQAELVINIPRKQNFNIHCNYIQISQY